MAVDNDHHHHHHHLGEVDLHLVVVHLDHLGHQVRQPGGRGEAKCVKLDRHSSDLKSKIPRSEFRDPSDLKSKIPRSEIQDPSDLKSKT